MRPSLQERKVVQKLFEYLEDQRVLYAEAYMENPRDGISRITAIREHVSQIMRENDDLSASLLQILRRTRSACRDIFPEDAVSSPKDPTESLDAVSYALILGRIRGQIGRDIEELGRRYEVEVWGDLRRLISIDYNMDDPPPPEDSEYKTQPRERWTLDELNKFGNFDR